MRTQHHAGQRWKQALIARAMSQHAREVSTRTNPAEEKSLRGIDAHGVDVCRDPHEPVPRVVHVSGELKLRGETIRGACDRDVEGGNEGAG
jgi:hypothetical protein